MTELKVGVIGCGRHSESHFEEIKKDQRLHLSAIAEVDPERLEESASTHKPDSSFSDYQDMLQKTELDLVYLVEWFHLYLYLMKFIQAGQKPDTFFIL